MASDESSTIQKPQKTEILLYLHNYSFYSQKVLMALHEKGINFNTYFVNIASGEQYQPAYLKINPKGEVPVIKDEETIITDSERIINYLEDIGSQRGYRSLIPTDEGGDITERHNHFHKVIHGLPAEVITVGSFYHQEYVSGPKLPFIYPTRRHMKNQTERAPAKLRKLAEEQPDVAETLKSKADHLEAEIAIMKDPVEYKKVLDEVHSVLDEVEEQLAKHKDTSKWLLSEMFTVADIDLTILLERLNVIGLENEFWGKRPNIAAYFARVKQKDSYKKSMPTTLFHIKTFLKAVTYMQIV